MSDFDSLMRAAEEGLRIAERIQDRCPDDPIESSLEAALGEIEERFRRIRQMLLLIEINKA